MLPLLAVLALAIAALAVVDRFLGYATFRSGAGWILVGVFVALAIVAWGTA